MFDLDLDPSEKNNIIKDNPERAKELKQKAMTLIEQHINYQLFKL